MRIERSLVGLLVLVMGGCGGADASSDGVERRDSAGVAIVTNHGAERPLAWRFEEVLRLGGTDDGPEAFAGIFPTGLGVDAEGSIHVLDARAHRLSVFDRNGAYVRSVGRRGGGPGEMQFPADLAVAEDGTAAVYDFSKQGVVRFGPQGEVLPEVPLRGDLQRKLIATMLGLVGVFQERQAADSPVVRRLIAISGQDTLRIAQQTASLMKMVQFPDCGMRVTMPPVFAPEIVWTARGERIAVNSGPIYVFDVYERGQLRMSVRRAVDPILATAELAAREVGDTLRMMGGSVRCAVGPKDVAESRGYAAVVPPLRDLALSPDGTWWASRRTASGAEKAVTDLFSSEGEYLGTLPPGAPWPGVFRGADEIVTVERDELDLPFVVVYRIRRGQT